MPTLPHPSSLLQDLLLRRQSVITSSNSTGSAWEETGTVDGGHAVVIGGSLAGLLAARVLAEHYAQVTVLERDRFPADPQPRPGVPQARHIHIVLLRGWRLLERWFPGLEAELAAAGAPSVDWTADFPALGLGGWAPRFRSRLRTRTCSRALLEWTVRRRVAAHPRVRLRDGCQVSGFLADARHSRVTGVELRPYPVTPAASDATPLPPDLRADLVVDASGRTSRTPQWLAQLGYPPPRELVVNAFLGYATRWYRRPAHHSADWQGLLIGYKPPTHTRWGVLFPVEGERWVVGLNGVSRDYPPTDPEGFVAFARSLRSPALYEAMAQAEPLSPIYGYRRTENQWRRYDRVPRWPAGLVVLGDAVCAFNPIYGQGITVAALEARALERRLRAQRGRGGRGEPQLARQVQRDVAAVIRLPWLMATREDARWPATQGRPPDRLSRLLYGYLDQVLLLTGQSREVYQVFLEVTHLLRPPTAFLAPAIVRQVLAHALQQPRPDERAHPRPLTE